MIELLFRLANTSVPVVLSILGGILLLIAIGVQIKAVVDVSGVSKVTAAVLSIVCLAAAAGLWYLKFRPLKGEAKTPQPPAKQGREPFLQYYIACGLILVILFIVIMAYSQGASQRNWVAGLFIVSCLVASAIVFVRHQAVSRYLQDPGTARWPLGLHHGHSNLFPYFILVGAVMVAMMWVMLHYTKELPNTANRDPLLWYFVGLFAYLMVCRVVWEMIDSKVPPSSAAQG